MESICSEVGRPLWKLQTHVCRQDLITSRHEEDALLCLYNWALNQFVVTHADLMESIIPLDLTYKNSNQLLVSSANKHTHTHNTKETNSGFYSEIYLPLTGIDIEAQILLGPTLYPQIKFSLLLFNAGNTFRPFWLLIRDQLSSSSSRSYCHVSKRKRKIFRFCFMWDDKLHGLVVR